MKSSEAPVIQSELQAVKKLISSQGISLKHEIKSVRLEVKSVKLEVQSLSKRIDSLDSKMDSRFDQLHTEIYKVLVIVEEQNAGNKAVMDQKALIQLKIEQHDTRLIRLEKNR